MAIAEQTHMVALLGGELVEGHRPAHLSGPAGVLPALAMVAVHFNRTRASKSLNQDSFASGEVDAVDIVDSVWC